GIIIDGMMKVLCWVTAVMLPPMAIFFALFTLLEDFGYLPRVAFCLDEPFRKCGTCGKQALTMCMGLGCNCTGVTGCRIINSQKEKIISIITNNFIPCNGRFPILIAVITMFFAGIGFNGRMGAALIFSAVIIFSIFITFLISKLLSKTIVRSDGNPFVMELPPYRKPDTVKVLFRSVFDRTLFVLARAVCVAAPAGIIIWLLTHIDINGVSVFGHITQILDPVGRIMGLDGVILTGFILGLPANEIVIPIIMMGYLSTSTLENYTSLASLAELFRQNGWDICTAVSMVIFTVFHWPCSTAIITIKKETASLKWTAVSVILPTLIGFLLCCFFNLIIKLF
ncbi:MAG: ferrous iron transporter B, partial [Clostridia bacterium]|nr:ferrous iron transporter B [Clostridia bacterium]